MKHYPSSSMESEDIYFNRNASDKINHSQWSLVGSNCYKSIPKSCNQLPSGSYTLQLDSYDEKPVFIKKDIKHDNLISISGIPAAVTQEITEFWKKEKEFTNLGFLHRRGYLFYGNQGTGKSSLIFQIISSMKDAVVFYCEYPHVFNIGLSTFRLIEPNRKIICVFEDIDEIMKVHGEKMLLSILDGDNQVNGVINLATTNYPELVNKRIIGRPRRFDRVYKIEALSTKAREEFLKKKLPKTENISEWVTQTAGLSIASISEVIISTLCFGKKLNDSVSIVKELMKSHKTTSDEEGEIGFIN